MCETHNAISDGSRPGLGGKVETGTISGTKEVKDVQSWNTLLVPFRQPNTARSITEIIITIVPFVTLWALSALAFSHGYWWGLVLTIPAAGFLVRLFALQHDCGHGALFRRRKPNDWTGRIIGIFTLTPYDYWRRSHAIHHATSGNLDKRGVGDIKTLTVREYRALPFLARIQYRLYRHPAILFGLGPAWLFVCQYRLPFGMMRSGTQPWVSTIATNIFLVLLIAGLIWLTGLWTFLAVQIPITLIAATAGVWLFFIQHQFEDTHWSDGEDWNIQDASLQGSSHYDLPAVLQWITGNIGIHHVHHLCAKVPFYRLPEVLKAYPTLRDMGRITFLESLACVKLVLWDENAKRLVTFREARIAAA